MTDAPELSDAESVWTRAFGIHEASRETVDLALLRARTAEQIEDAAENVRLRLAPMPVGEMLKTPDEMVSDLEFAKWGSSRIALVLKHSRQELRDTQRDLREARARVLQRSVARSADLRQAEVDLECADLITAAETAQIVLDFAKDVARAVEQTGSMTQTQAGLVKAQMSLAGTGREA